MPAGAASRAHNVIDLDQWRASRRPQPVPSEVLAEMDAAARVYEALLAQGHELRFLPPRPPAADRVRAELRVVGGEAVREVSLSEVVGLDGPPAA